MRDKETESYRETLERSETEKERDRKTELEGQIERETVRKKTPPFPTSQQISHK